MPRLKDSHFASFAGTRRLQNPHTESKMSGIYGQSPRNERRGVAGSVNAVINRESALIKGSVV
jgi:hypothetical protein